MSKLPKINPYESLEEAIIFDWFKMMDYSNEFESKLIDGSAKLTSMQSRNLCTILKMEKSDFWKTLYDNYNKKDEKKIRLT